MSSDDARPEITGETTVTLWDQFKAFYWSAPWLWWVLAACCLIIFLSSLGDDEDSDTFFSAPMMIGLFVLLWAVIIVISYWRLSREQKQVRYRLTTERIEISDGTGVRRDSLDRDQALYRDPLGAAFPATTLGPTLAAKTRLRRCHGLARPRRAMLRLQGKVAPEPIAGFV